MELVAVQLDDLNRATRMIVGDAVWATENLGGRWIQIVREEEGKTYPSIDDVWDEENQDFIHNPIVVIQNAS